MAIVMKELMDLFYEETQREDSGFERDFVFGIAVSLTNNCHQKSPREIYEFLTTTFTGNKNRAGTSTAEQTAWDDALLLLEIYFDNKF